MSAAKHGLNYKCTDGTWASGLIVDNTLAGSWTDDTVLKMLSLIRYPLS